MQSCIILLRSNLKLEINEFKNKEKIFVHKTTKQNIQEIQNKRIQFSRINGKENKGRI